VSEQIDPPAENRPEEPRQTTEAASAGEACASQDLHAPGAGAASESAPASEQSSEPGAAQPANEAPATEVPAAEVSDAKPAPTSEAPQAQPAQQSGPGGAQPGEASSGPQTTSGEQPDEAPGQPETSEGSPGVPEPSVQETESVEQATAEAPGVSTKQEPETAPAPESPAAAVPEPQAASPQPEPETPAQPPAEQPPADTAAAEPEQPAEAEAPAEPKSEKMDWYILKVQSNREESIKEGLLRRVQMAGLERYFGQVIIPTETVTEFKGGKKRIVKRKLYPGYLVVQMEVNDDTWFLVRETPGIGDFTGAAGQPTPMAPHEVEAILQKSEDKPEKQPKLKIAFKPGDQVKINEGTFENFEGTVESIDETNGRVTVIINIFGRSTPVELEYWQVGAV